MFLSRDTTHVDVMSLHENNLIYLIMRNIALYIIVKIVPL